MMNEITENQNEEFQHVHYEMYNFLRSYEALSGIIKFDLKNIEHIAYLNLFAISCRVLIEYFHLHKTDNDNRDIRYPLKNDIKDLYDTEDHKNDKKTAEDRWKVISKGTAHLSKKRIELCRNNIEPQACFKCLKPAFTHFMSENRLKLKNQTDLTKFEDLKKRWKSLKENEIKQYAQFTTVDPEKIEKHQPFIKNRSDKN